MRTQSSRQTAPRPMEHRWGERVTLDCPARLVLHDGSGADGRVRNASISGALIETTRKLPVYTTVNIIVSAGVGGFQRMIELPACVVRSASEGVAVEWRDMGVPTLVSLLGEAGGDESRLRMRMRMI